jgi:hypothetical protein
MVWVETYRNSTGSLQGFNFLRAKIFSQPAFFAAKEKVAEFPVIGLWFSMNILYTHRHTVVIYRVLG